MWLIQKRPLDDTWRMHSSLILDVPSMNPRGRSILDENLASSQMDPRHFISTISSGHLDKPPDYYDALIRSKPISWYLSSANTSKSAHFSGHVGSLDEAHHNTGHIRYIDALSNNDGGKLRNIIGSANNSTICLYNSAQDKPYHRKRSLCLQCIKKCHNQHKGEHDTNANDVMSNSAVNNNRSCIVDLAPHNHQALNLQQLSLSCETDNKMETNTDDGNILQRTTNGMVTQIALNLMKGIGSNYRAESQAIENYNNLKYNRRRSSPLDRESPISLDRCLSDLRQCDNLTKGVESFRGNEFLRENSFHQLDVRQLNQFSDLVEPPSYSDLVKRGLVED